MDNYRKNIDELFWNQYYSIDEKSILKINEYNFSVELNNVVVRINKHCYGLMINDEIKVEYQLFYVNGTKDLQGELLKLSLGQQQRNEILFYFSRFLTEKYENLDIIEVFNTFQSFTQSFLEKIGFTTITSFDCEQLIDPNPVIMAKNTRGIVPILILKKENFYVEFMNQNRINRENSDTPQIYLMLNKKTGNIKIGRSKNPNFREKTLQGEEPEIQLISIWEAPKNVESQLHKKYIEKRIRGEWFKLSFNDLKEIKEEMKIFE
jgi:hypothetical protein